MTVEEQVYSPADSIRVRDELAKILASHWFVRSSRMGEFLSFLVENTLEGNTDILKQTCIGMMVFRREATYDPKIDPIVRVEARRLRSKLREYYENEGAFDGVIIQLPEVGYKPVFHIREIPNEELEVAPDPLPVTPDPEPPIVSSPSAPSAAPHRFSSWRGLMAMGTVVVLVIAIGVAGLLAHRTRVQPDFSRIVPLTTFFGQEFDPAISPDGSHLAFVWSGQGEGKNYDIYVKAIGGGELSRLTSDPAHDLHPTWSPDGRDIAFLRISPNKAVIVIVPAKGGPERVLGEIHNSVSVWRDDAFHINGSLGPSWSTDGVYLALADNPSGQGNGLYLWPLGYGQKRHISSPETGSNDFSPAFSPDGKQIAFVRQTSNSASDVYVQSLSGGSPTRLTHDNLDIRGLTWTPDNRSVVFSSNRGGNYGLWKVAVQGNTAPEVVPVSSDEPTQPRISRDGSLLVFTHIRQNINIWRMSLDAHADTTSQRLISSSQRNDSPAYSPDGKQIVFVSDRSGSWELWICQEDGETPRQLTSFHGPLPGSPRWSPDGKWIAFDARPNGHSTLFLIPSAGGTARPLGTNSAEERMPSWSHDGQWLYFNSDRSGAIRLWKLHVATGEVRPLTQRVAYDSYESSDGRWIYFRSDGPGIWRVSVDGTKEAIVPELAAVPASRYFAVAGDNFYFVDQEISPRHINVFNMQTHRIRRLGTIQQPIENGTPSLSVSPDERWAVFAQQDESSGDILSVRWR